MKTITREEVLERLKKTKEIKQQSIKEMKAFLRGVHYAETGIMLKDSDFVVW